MRGGGELSPESIRWAKDRLGVSQARLGELLGVHETTVWRWMQSGGPRYLAFALAGLLLAEGDVLGATTWLEQRAELEGGDENDRTG